MKTNPKNKTTKIALKKRSPLKKPLFSKKKLKKLEIEYNIKKITEEIEYVVKNNYEFMVISKFSDGTHLIQKQLPFSDLYHEGRKVPCGDFQPVIKNFRCAYHIVFMIGPKSSKYCDEIDRFIKFGTPDYRVDNPSPVRSIMLNARASEEKEFRL